MKKLILIHSVNFTFFLERANDWTMNDVFVYFLFLNVNANVNVDDVVVMIDVLQVMTNANDLVNDVFLFDLFDDRRRDRVESRANFKSNRRICSRATR